MKLCIVWAPLFLVSGKKSTSHSPLHKNHDPNAIGISEGGKIGGFRILAGIVQLFVPLRLIDLLIYTYIL